jgi:DNA polymerase-2
MFIPEATASRLTGCSKASATSNCAPCLCDFHQRQVLGLYTRQHRQAMDLEKRLRAAGVDVLRRRRPPPSAT